VIARNQLVQRHHFQFGLSSGCGRLEHAAIIKNKTPDGRGLGALSAV
jgi:hypothetical protein